MLTRLAMLALIALVAGCMALSAQDAVAQDARRIQSAPNPIDNNPLARGAPFEALRGLLPLPAQGRRVLNYGAPTPGGSSSHGILIETAPGALVRAPCDGWVVFAESMSGYGRVAVINAADGFHVMLAGFGGFEIQVGDFVAAGDPIGRLPLASQIAAGEERRGLLYLELRKDGQPIDSTPWWPQR